MMVGLVPCLAWLEIDWLLSQFGGSRKVAIDNYINFVREGIGLAPIWKSLKRQVFLGDDTFITNVQGMMVILVRTLECNAGQLQSR